MNRKFNLKKLKKCVDKSNAIWYYSVIQNKRETTKKQKKKNNPRPAKFFFEKRFFRCKPVSIRRREIFIRRPGEEVTAKRISFEYHSNIYIIFDT